MGDGAADYEQVVAAARENPDVVGLILTGSRGRDVFVRPDSDWDVRLVVTDEAFAEVAKDLATPHGAPVEVVVFSLGSFATMGRIGAPTEWDRYSYTHCEVVVDKLDGTIHQLVGEQARLSPVEALQVAGNALDDYINSYYRAIKNVRLGLDAAAHLDAAESVSPLLSTLFAIYERVRPFNKFLAWELERFPLPDRRLDAKVLIPRLRALLATARLDDQASLFRDVEEIARAKQLGTVIDSWEPHVAWLRSGNPSGTPSEGRSAF